MKYTFRPNIWITIITMLMLSACIKLGMWQYNKAESRRALQTQLNARQNELAVALPDKIANLEDWRFKKVTFTASYDTQYQILLDNQVHQTVAGYHVLTPVKIKGSDVRVLVNRGWVARVKAQMGEMPKPPVIETPDGTLQIEGDIALPANKFFTMESADANGGKWQTVWQNLDMARYAKSVPFKVQPYIVRLSPTSKVGGFIRDWPPPGERVSMHLGYAYQWFGFAATLLVIFIVLNVKKVEQ